jgi:hypothetical protein
MPAEPSQEVKFDIGHVLFIDIVGYSKLLIEEQKERLSQLTTIAVSSSHSLAPESLALWVVSMSLCFHTLHSFAKVRATAKHPLDPMIKPASGPKQLAFEGQRT